MSDARAYDVVTFDCYGTLVDWEGGIVAAFVAAAACDGVTLRRESILAAHAEIEPRVQAGAYRSYRDVLERIAREAAVRWNWSLDAAQASFLPESLAVWHPFADTIAALRRLVAAGYSLGILSNVDDDLLAATLAQLDVPFELIVTAQQVRSYKPAPAHFAEARRRIGGRRWLHAAQSWFHDVAPACELGIPVAWINRNGEAAGDAGARPDREFPDLRALADWLAPSPG